MPATASSLLLFPDGLDNPLTCRERTDASSEWFLTLRHAQIPFQTDHSLMVLHGHPLVLRLGLHAAADRALAGEPVVYLDGANTFDPFVIGRLARAHRQTPRKILSLVHVARAFTCHQMERLVSDCLEEALMRYQARIAVVSGLFETFYDEAVPSQEVTRLAGRMMQHLRRMAQRGYVLVCLCPPIPAVMHSRHRFIDQLCGQADRVIRVGEAPGRGIIRLEEEPNSRGAGQVWEVARTVLESR